MASATTGNNYFTKSMNSIIEIDDGAGTTISDGAIFTNSISTDNFSTTSLTCNTIDTNTINSTTGNIGTGNIGTLNSTLGTVTTLNSTTGTIGTVNSTNTTTSTLTTNNIQSNISTDTIDLTAKTINLNGTQAQTKMYISKYNNNSFEMVTNTGISYIDFHSSNLANLDFDARVSCEGGGPGGGKGYLTLRANTIELQTPSILCLNPDGTTPTLNIPIINSTTIDNLGTAKSNILIADVSGSIPTLTTSTINNLATINSISSQYWKTGGIVMRPYNKVPNSGSWFSMNYDDSSNIERNALQFDAGAYGVNLIVDDNLPFAINENGVDQVSMTPANGWTFNNKINTTYDASFGLIKTTNINNSGAITSNSLNSTTGTITTLNSTNATFNNATINNSLTVPGISTTYANFQNIQAVTPTTDTNVYTTSTGNINIGGSGKIYLNKDISNNGIETGIDTSVSPTPYIDFHSSSNSVDYDATIYCQNGTSTKGQGDLFIKSKRLYLHQDASSNGIETGIDTTSGIVPYIDFHSSSYNIDYDASIYCTGGTTTIGEGTLNLKAKQINLTGNINFSNFLKNQVSSVKVLNQTYQNTNTTPKFISISATNGSPSVLTARTDANTPPTTNVGQSTLYNNEGIQIFFIVLPGNYYRVETSAGGTLQNWTEWG